MKQSLRGNCRQVSADEVRSPAQSSLCDHRWQGEQCSRTDCNSSQGGLAVGARSWSAHPSCISVLHIVKTRWHILRPVSQCGAHNQELLCVSWQQGLLCTPGQPVLAFLKNRKSCSEKSFTHSCLLTGGSESSCLNAGLDLQGLWFWQMAGFAA